MLIDPRALCQKKKNKQNWKNTNERESPDDDNDDVWQRSNNRFPVCVCDVLCAKSVWQEKATYVCEEEEEGVSPEHRRDKVGVVVKEWSCAK